MQKGYPIKHLLRGQQGCGDLAAPTPSERWQTVGYANAADLTLSCEGAFAVVSTLIGVEVGIIDTQPGC